MPGTGTACSAWWSSPGSRVRDADRAWPPAPTSRVNVSPPDRNWSACLSDVTDRLASMSADKLSDFFRTADVVEITDVIRSTSDDELRALIDLDHFRAE